MKEKNKGIFVSAQQIYNDVDVQEVDEIIYKNKYTGIKSDDLFLSKENYENIIQKLKDRYMSEFDNDNVLFPHEFNKIIDEVLK